jgi:predicted ATPase
VDRQPLSAPGSRWEVQLLGGLQVRSGHIEIPRLADKAERLLFARLALQPRTAHGRDDLAQVLWPDIVDASGHEPRDAPAIRRQRLRRVLSKLNSHFANGGAQLVAPFIADRDTVRLNAEAFDIDTERFDRHVARRQWAAARACYRGELLPGLHDPWIDEQRARLAAAFGWASAELNPDDGTADAAWDEDDDEHGEEASGPIVPYVTRFFGREAETETLRGALAEHRLVSVLGPGGCGKTRLAAEALRGLRGFEPIAFVALSECMAAQHLLEHLRTALGLTPAARPAIEQIAERLEDQAALLVFDNFEQLVGPAADGVLTALLQRLPLARLLVTSRRSLQRCDEFAIALQPLPLPDGDDSLSSAARNAGVMLFVDRARAARSDFTLNARNLSGVIEVCRRVEGLPLAIELAAAKIRSHSPQRMGQALERGLRLLSKSSARVGEVMRHASLEAALAWSWGLLNTMQRDLLCSLSVFRGGWTADQARAVAALPAGDRSLHALARDSLLRWQPDSGGGQQRLGMLDALREFVEARFPALRTSALRQRHRSYFAALSREADTRQEWPNEADQPNLVQALMTAWADGDDAVLSKLTSALSAQWLARGAPAQVIEVLCHAVQAPRLGARQRVGLSAVLTKLLIHSGHIVQAQAVAADALRLAGSEPALRASALLAQSDVHWRAGRSADDAARALALVQEALSLMPPHSHADAASSAMHGQLLLLKGAITLQHLHDVAGAESLFSQAEQLFDALADRRRALQAAPGRAACLLAQARHEACIAAASNALRLAAELGDVVTQLQLFDRLSSAFAATGQFDQALQACRKQVRLARAHGMAYYAAYGAWNQCHPLVRLDHAPAAARLMAFARQLWTKQFGPLDSDDEGYVEQVRREVAERIGAARLRTEWVRGEALTAREAWALAAGLGTDGEADAKSN